MKKFEPDFKIMIAGKDVTSDISADIISLEYCDYVDGQSDECSVEVHNTDGKWLDAWFPNKGDILKISLGYKNGLVDYSDCEIDSLEFEFYPHTLRICALSAGITKGVRTRKGKAYENTTLANIAASIAQKNKLKVVGKIKNIQIKRATQYQERDVEFLLRISKEHGHTFKIVGDQLVFTDQKDAKDQEPVRVIKAEELMRLSIRDKLKDVARSVTIKYQAKGKKKYREKTIEAKGKTSSDKVIINARYDDEEEGENKAQAALDEQNDDKTQATLTLLGDPKLVAGLTIELTDIGKLSGKYMINSSRHSYGRSDGYTTDLDCKRVDIEEIEEKKDDGKDK